MAMRPTQDTMSHDTQQFSIPYHQGDATNDMEDVDIELGMYEASNPVGQPPAYPQDARTTPSSGEKPIGPQATRRPYVPEAARISDFSKRKHLLASMKGKKTLAVMAALLLAMTAGFALAHAAPWIRDAAEKTVHKFETHLPRTDTTGSSALNVDTRHGAVLYEAVPVSGSHPPRWPHFDYVLSEKRHVPLSMPPPIHKEGDGVLSEKRHLPLSMPPPIHKEGDRVLSEKRHLPLSMPPPIHKEGDRLLSEKRHLPLSMPPPIHKEEGDRLLPEKRHLPLSMPPPIYQEGDRLLSEKNPPAPNPDTTTPHLPPITPLLPFPFPFPIQQNPSGPLSQGREVADGSEYREDGE